MLASARKDVPWLVNKPLPGQADCSEVSVFWNGCTINFSLETAASSANFQAHFRSSPNFTWTGILVKHFCVHIEASELLYGKLREYTEVQHHVSRSASLPCPTIHPWHFCRASDWAQGLCALLGSTKRLPYPRHLPFLCQMYLVTWCVNM